MNIYILNFNSQMAHPNNEKNNADLESEKLNYRVNFSTTLLTNLCNPSG